MIEKLPPLKESDYKGIQADIAFLGRKIDELIDEVNELYEAVYYLTLPTKPEDWEKTFELFYDSNETGGSSRWKVTPDTVKQFIRGLLKEKDLK